VLDVPFKRVAVTVPPRGWFHGIAHAIFQHYRQGLVDLGMTVADVPVEPFASNDVGRIREIAESLRHFGPDLAFGLPKGAYALICRMPARRGGTRPNLFTDVLDIPTICYWDHAPLELVDQVLGPLPDDSSRSTAGVMDAMREAMTHPRVVHWSRDGAQTAIMSELGWLPADGVIHEMPPCLPGFTLPAASAPILDRREPRVAFVGHVYQDAAVYAGEELDALAHRTVRSWLDGPVRSVWSVLGEERNRLRDDARHRLALDLDQTYFWRFASRLTLNHAQTALRLRMLGAARTDVACYGNLTPGLDVAGTLHPRPGLIPFGPDLAQTLARHPVTIDVLSPGTIDGYSHKPLLGFAAGGFVLLDRKPHFVEAFGDAGSAVSYDSPDDLAGKLDLYLSNDGRRREVGDAIRQRIAERFQLTQVLTRVLRAASRYAAGAAGRAVARTPAPEPPSRVRLDLLPSLRSEPHWDASVRHVDGVAEIATSPRTWAYAAVIDIPPEVAPMIEPHLRMRLAVATGRIGVATVDDASGSLLSEQTVGPGSAAALLVVELPPNGVRHVFLRNAAEATSRARVLEISLCDRAP
jgi:hypothetical protein